MRSGLFAAALVLAFAPAAAAQPADCGDRVLSAAAEDGVSNVAAGLDGDAARKAWTRVLDCGAAIAWPATLYSVDARSTFVFAFDRTALSVYRTRSDRLEAVIPWSNIREIEAGNWVIWFRLKTPVEITSDRGKRKRVKELKVYFSGAGGGDLTYYYNIERVRHRWFWCAPVYEVTNLRGIAVGPTGFQRRVQHFLADLFDPDHHITLKQKGRGAGW